MLEKGFTDMNLNKAELIGNLTRDPEHRKLPSGTAVTTFTMATQHSWRDIKTKEQKESAEFHKVIAWGRLAEIISKYLKKGSKVYLEGKLQSRRWKDKQGNLRETTQVVANNMIMLGSAGRRKEKPEAVVREEVDIQEVETD